IFQSHNGLTVAGGRVIGSFSIVIVVEGNEVGGDLGKEVGQGCHDVSSCIFVQRANSVLLAGFGTTHVPVLRNISTT
ncbi:hypothetical protein Tco_1305865, partial [Tanacetum coccineum]